MIPRVVSCFWGVALIGVALWLAPPKAAAQGTQGIIFSQTQNQSAISNFNENAPAPASAPRIEIPVHQPDLLRSGTPFGGPPPIIAPPPPAIPSRRMMDLIRKSKEEKDAWLFSNPEDKKMGLTAQEIFDLPEYDDNGLQKTEEETPFEKFYKSDRDRIGVTNRIADFGNSTDDDAIGRLFNSRDARTRSDTPTIDLPFERSSPFTAPSASMITEMASPVEMWSPFAAAPTTGIERQRIHEQRMSEFEQLLQSSPAAPSVSSSPFAPAPTASSPAGLAPAPAVVISPFSPFSASVTAGLPERPVGLPEANLSPYSAGFTPPVSEEPQRPVMPPPVFSMPQRR